MGEDEERVQYSFEGTVTSLRNAVNGAIDLFDRYEARMKKVPSFDPVAGLNKAIKSLGINKLGDALSKAAEKSISFIEDLNLFTVAMGDSIAEGTRFVKQMSEVYGMDPGNLYRTAGYFYQLTDAIGMASDASATLSLSLTKASNDIASLFNVDIQTVVNNLASGMQGMSRAVRKYGMDIRATTLQETAYTYGLTEKVSAMSEANRMALRYLTMMQQVKNATQQVSNTAKEGATVMGDFAKNIETPANQLRILQEQVAQVGRAIGNFLLPILARVLPVLNGFAMALKEVLSFISALLGIDNISFGGASGIAAETEALDTLGETADSTSKKLKALTAPFDELNVISENTAASAGTGGLDFGELDPKLAQAIQEMSLELEDIRMKAHDVRDSLLEFFGFDYVSVFNPDTGEFESKLQWFSDKFEENLINKFPQWENTIQSLFDNWSKIVDGFKSIFSALWEVILQVASTVKGDLSGAFGDLTIDEAFARFIESFPRRLNEVSDWLREHKEAIARVVVTITEVVAAMHLADGAIGLVTKALAPLFAAIKLVHDILGPIIQLSGGVSLQALAVVAVIGLVVAAIIDLWNTDEEFRQDVIEILNSLKKAVRELWVNVVQPVLQIIGSTLKVLWETIIKPVVKAIMEIVSQLMSEVLEPLIAFLSQVLGPRIQSIMNSVLEAVTPVLQSIMSMIAALLQILNGLINFIVGVFTGDWQRAWSGIKDIFVGIVNLIIGAAEGGINLIIGLVNSLVSLVWNALQALVNGITRAISGIASSIGLDLNIRWSAKPPAIPNVHFGRVALANGGVITRPTQAIIGEGKYDEAVIPLGNSPQMRELVQDIAEAVNSTKNTAADTPPIEVRVFIGDAEWDAFTYESAKRGEQIVGAKPIKVGG